MRVFKDLGIIVGTVDRAGLDALRSKSDTFEIRGAPVFDSIEPMLSVNPPNPTDVTWGISALKIDQLWARGLTGKNVLIGHLDSGIEGTHPAFYGRDAIKWFVETDADGNLYVPMSQHDDDRRSHGTHTAGTIAGREVGGVKIGVAPDAQLLSCIVMEGGIPSRRVIAGMEWALNHGARIINMSLGVRGYDASFEPVMRKLRARGVLPVVAVGNKGHNRSLSPGDYPEALSVGACDSGRRIWENSCSREFPRPQDPIVPDLVAPGVKVYSARRGGDYGWLDGTSQAAPHISGLAALLLEAAPSATADQLEAAILGSCTLPATLSAERANHGFPDAVRALEILLSSALGPVG